MNRTRVKICGITNLIDAQAAIDAGADALGFVFYPKSPRYISFQNAEKVCSQTKPDIMKIGVFVNENIENLCDLSNRGFLTHFQFSGDESADYCEQFADKAIKTFRVKNGIDKNLLKNFQKCKYFLFDSGSDGSYGGSGRIFDWEYLKEAGLNKNFILAGGLTPENVKEAILSVKPFMVDVSSGVEKTPGIKDHDKIIRFIDACRSVDSFSV
ncbi:phosphoribosylanthranilate isomerase [candidate division KSB1 bacterium]